MDDPAQHHWNVAHLLALHRLDQLARIFDIGCGGEADANNIGILVHHRACHALDAIMLADIDHLDAGITQYLRQRADTLGMDIRAQHAQQAARRSEEHTSELQSLMRISYAVFCLKNKKTQLRNESNKPHTKSNH